MVLASHLLELSATELEAVLQHEAASNPALTLDVTDDPTWQQETLSTAQRSQYSDGSSFDVGVWQVSAREQLVAQARLIVAADELDIVTYVIQSLDIYQPGNKMISGSRVKFQQKSDLPLAGLFVEIRLLTAYDY
jgi:DNA-directed RNA polymerase specialized sigma54-like protein